MEKQILTVPDIEVKHNFFFDDEKGVLVDLSVVIKEDSNIKLSEVESICNNITRFVKKDNYYYLDDYKYLSVEEMNKYMDELFKGLNQNIIKEKKYLVLKHIGSYNDRYKTYKKLFDIIDKNKYKIVGVPVEQYISGSWCNVDESKYVTNIMIPIG